jgi:hypothetical protein
MLTALVLICSAAVTPDVCDCTRANATAVMRVPAKFGNPAACLLHGQAYLAETSIARELSDSEQVKIVCASRNGRCARSEAAKQFRVEGERR